MVVVFDVNETLLDLSPIRAGFAEEFGDPAVAGEWFSTLLRLSFVDAVTGDYHPFTELGRAAFDMVASARGVEVDPIRRDEIVTRIRRLPPHSDVLEGLRRLSGAGIRLAALTNSPLETAVAQLEHAGIAPFLEQIMSVDTVRTFKPAARVYRAAAARLGIPITRMLMVAAHDWDVAGAMAAGAQGAFLARPGKVLSPLQPRPRFQADDLVDLAEAIVRS